MDNFGFVYDEQALAYEQISEQNGVLKVSCDFNK